MATLNEQYVVDHEGKRIAILLGVADYTRLMEEVEELACLRAFDEAVQSGDESLPFDQAIAEIEGQR